MTPERRAELVLRGVSLLVVGSVAVALAALTWRLTGMDDGRRSIATAETAPVRTGGADADVARLLALAPFGGGSVGELPASSLGLILKGVLLAYPAEASLAMISMGEGPATAYGVGGSPGGAAVIETIEVDRVILKVGDRRELLSFPQAAVAAAPQPPATLGAGITIAPGAMSAAASSLLNAGSPQSATAPAPPAAAAPATQGRPAQTSALAVDPAQTLSTLGVTATAEGYRIGQTVSPELRRFGLQAGDVIASLNGQPIASVANDRQLVERAMASGGARVEVVRSGRRLTVTLPLR